MPSLNVLATVLRRLLQGCACPCRRRRHGEESLMQEQRTEAGKQHAELMVRSMNGDIIYEQDDIEFSMPIHVIVQKICEQNGGRCDTVQLCSGGSILDHALRIGDFILPSDSGKVELTFVRLQEPALTASSTIGGEIQVLNRVPVVGDKCYLDRSGCKFTSLGDFSNKPNMKYILTGEVYMRTWEQMHSEMWKLDLRVPAIVYLNFRSESLVTLPNVMEWLVQEAWEESDMATTVHPGPYGTCQGPVYCKTFMPGMVNLKVGNCFGPYLVDELQELEISAGPYLVFVEVLEHQ